MSRRGLGIPEPQLRAHPTAPPPRGPLGHRWSFRVGELAGPSESPVTFEGTPRQNACAHLPIRQCPQLSEPLRTLHSRRIRPTCLLGVKPNPKSAPEEPLTSAQLAAQRTGCVLDLPDSWGLTLTIGRPPWGPSQGAWRRNAGDGDTEPKCRTHPAALQPPEPLGAHRSIRARKRLGPSEHPLTFKGPPR